MLSLYPQHQENISFTCVIQLHCLTNGAEFKQSFSLSLPFIKTTSQDGVQQGIVRLTSSEMTHTQGLLTKNFCCIHLLYLAISKQGKIIKQLLLSTQIPSTKTGGKHKDRIFCYKSHTSFLINILPYTFGVSIIFLLLPQFNLSMCLYIYMYIYLYLHI